MQLEQKLRFDVFDMNEWLKDMNSEATRRGLNMFNTWFLDKDKPKNKGIIQKLTYIKSTKLCLEHKYCRKKTHRKYWLKCLGDFGNKQNLRIVCSMHII